jgi:hypothetical protein
MDMRERVQRDKITAESVMTDAPAGAWDADRPQHARANWYRVTLHMGRRQMTVPFGMGPALTGEPEAAEVLDSLASDASSFENAAGFEDWASEFGYDTDSRKAERVWDQTEAQTLSLRRFLGDKYEAYVWHTGRL